MKGINSINKTNQTHTHEILNGWLMSDNNLNVESVVDNIRVEMVNTRHLWDRIRNRRIKPESIAKSAICEWVNSQLTWHGYKTVCTWRQIASYGHDIDKVISGVIQCVIDERTEMDEEED